ncbi:MAG: hypothetical protein ACJAWL_001266 [Motiliproteus sp.]|jgi:hypothetical protein
MSWPKSWDCMAFMFLVKDAEGFIEKQTSGFGQFLKPLNP